jgi:protein-arginine kinase
MNPKPRQFLKLVDVMLDLRKREQRVEGHELDQLRRQIEKTDREIDERVYRSYGITEAEKRLIE